MSSELMDFFNEKQEKENKEKVDWDKEKQEWLKNIALFNEQISKWLEEPLKNKLIKCSLEDIEVNEYLMGTYKVPALTIQSGKDVVYFKPIGKLVLGFNGRIDMVSYSDSKPLVYINDKGWFLFEQTKTRDLKPFDEKLFTELLKEMMS